MNSKSAEDKKKLANEKRLQSLKQWKQNLFNKDQKIKESVQNVDSESALPNKRIIFESDTGKRQNKVRKSHSHQVEASKPALFNSSDSEDEDDRFRIRPQFEGRDGQQMLEMSSQFSEQFKLDERFQEGNEDQSLLDRQSTEDTQNETSKERFRNFEILDQVLGFQVPRKESSAEMKLHNNKRHMRFDPDDESASKYIRKDCDSEDVAKKVQKKNKIHERVVEEVPVSTERYFEVSSDLKDILGSSSGQFSLSKTFNCEVEENSADCNNSVMMLDNDLPSNQGSNECKTSGLNKNALYSNDIDASTSKLRILKDKKDVHFEARNRVKKTFFIAEDDPRLKEGANFFMRPKPMEEIREQWARSRDNILELFKSRRRTSQRKPSLKSQIIQRKNNFAKRSSMY